MEKLGTPDHCRGFPTHITVIGLLASSSSSIMESYADGICRSVVMVRVKGIDPQSKKMDHAAFYVAEDGRTSLVSSGILLPRLFSAHLASIRGNPGAAYVLCTGNNIVPFLSSNSELAPDCCDCIMGSDPFQHNPPLVEGTKIEVLVEGSPNESQKGMTSEHNSSYSDLGVSSRWLECRLLKIGEVEGVQKAVGSLCALSSWVVGCRAPNTPQRRLITVGLVALLEVQANDAYVVPDGTPWASTRHLHRGVGVRVICSPYGLLSPAIFHNSISAGILSNFVGEIPNASPDNDKDIYCEDRDIVEMLTHSAVRPSSSLSTFTKRRGSASHVSPLILTDARCLPGSEGGAVIVGDRVIGMVGLPLRHHQNNPPVELNTVLSVDALYVWLARQERSLSRKIASPHHPNCPPATQPLPSIYHPITLTALLNHHIQHPKRHRLVCETYTPPMTSNNPQDRSMEHRIKVVSRLERSLVLARIGSSWASAVVISQDGYVVTNAHLIRPYLVKSSSKDAPSSGPSSDAPPMIRPSLGGAHLSVRLEPHQTTSCNPNLALSKQSANGPLPTPPVHPESGRSSGTWHKAEVVYVCQGPWDIALLKVSLPASVHLFPMHDCRRVPRRGESVFVIGHALFGPPVGLRPTVTMGVISRVANIPPPPAATETVTVASESTSRSNGFPDQVASPPSSSTSSQLSPHSSYSTMGAIPVLYQTDAAVHSGNSGGLLASAKGEFLGIVTSNVKHSWSPGSPTERHVEKYLACERDIACSREMHGCIKAPTCMLVSRQIPPPPPPPQITLFHTLSDRSFYPV